MKSVVCRKCVHLMNEWCGKVIDSPCPDIERNCQYFREKTNADRIRAMSDEELALLLIGYRDDYNDYRADTGFYDTLEEALEAEIEWLKQPMGAIK